MLAPSRSRVVTLINETNRGYHRGNDDVTGLIFGHVICEQHFINFLTEYLQWAEDNKDVDVPELGKFDSDFGLCMAFRLWGFPYAYTFMEALFNGEQRPFIEAEEYRGYHIYAAHRNPLRLRWIRETLKNLEG